MHVHDQSVIGSNSCLLSLVERALNLIDLIADYHHASASAAEAGVAPRRSARVKE